MKNKNVKDNSKKQIKPKKIVIVKPESQKNKRPKNSKKPLKLSYRAIIIPLFTVIALNLVFSLGLSVSATRKNSKQLAANTIANQISAKNKALTAKEMFLTAMSNLESSKHHTITASGEVKSFVNQKVSFKKVYDGKTHFMETKTTGFKNISTRAYANENNVKTIRSKGDLSFRNTHKPKSYTLKEFENKFNITPSQALHYNINSVSITNSTPPKKVNTGFEFSISLHPKLATKQYSKNIKQAAGISNEPKFNFINLNVLVDENHNFVKVETIEEYYIKVLGISKLCKSTLKMNFNFNKPASNAIPKI